MNIELLPTDRSNYLTDLAERIRAEHDAAEAAQSTATVAARKGIEHALAAGALLIEAKSLVPHGRWLPWLTENCPNIEERMARHYMRLARNRSELETQNGNVSDLSLRQAVKLLAPEPTDDDDDAPDSDEWMTPPEIIEAERDVLGTIDLDPSSCDEANEIAKATRYYTKEQDGLAQEWRGNIHLNCPYSNPAPWMNKLIDDYESEAVTAAIALVNHQTDAKWFQRALRHCTAYCLVEGRIRFLHRDRGKTGPARYGSVFFYFGPNVSNFAKRVAEYGYVERYDTRIRRRPKKPKPAPPVIPGDLANRMKIIRGNCLDILPTIAKPYFLVSDPPYNIGMRYDGYTDNLPEDEYQRLLIRVFKGHRAVVILDPKKAFNLFGGDILGRCEEIVTWVYNSNLPNQFRLVMWFNCKPDLTRLGQNYKNPDDKRIAKRIEQGFEARLYDVWYIDIVKNVSKDHDHPCPIPVELARRIVLVTTEPGDRIVDPFSGSGTIPAVAAAFGREGIGIDISEDYCEIARARLGTIIDELNNSPEEINENREQNDNVVYLSGVHRAFRFLARPTQGKKHLVKVEEVERWLSKSGLDNIGWTRTNL